MTIIRSYFVLGLKIQLAYLDARENAFPENVIILDVCRYEAQLRN